MLIGLNDSSVKFKEVKDVLGLCFLEQSKLQQTIFLGEFMSPKGRKGRWRYERVGERVRLQLS